MAIMSSVSTINSVIRTLLAVVVVGGVGTAGWFGYSTVRERDLEVEQTKQELAKAQELAENQAQAITERDRRLGEQQEELAERERRLAAQAVEIGELEEDVEQKKIEIDRLDTAMRLLKVDHRVARLTVVDQRRDPDTDRVTSRIRFEEVDQRGEPIDDPRVFDISGDVVYIDHWVVKFDELYVEQADPLRSASLVLFRRVFGEYQEPQDGFRIDPAGTRPKAYAGGTVPNDFEQQIWDDFWTIANDPSKAAVLGIRAAHGEAVSMKIRKGGRYRLTLRASDGLSIVPEDTGGPG